MTVVRSCSIVDVRHVIGRLGTRRHVRGEAMMKYANCKEGNMNEIQVGVGKGKRDVF